ncbi:MAG TPA: aspartyl protease family protein [Cyclobacteriaceae bacterium]
MARLLLIFIVTFAFVRNSYSQVLGFVIADGKKKIEIPIQIQNNLIVVPVILNDKLPLKFIVDTGVRTAILTQKTFSDILELPYGRKYSISGPGGEKIIDAYVTNNVSLSLPGVSGKGHALLVLEEDYLELRNFLGTDVHGILGYELFSRFIVKLDYSKKTMTLIQPDKFRPGRRYQELPMLVEDTKPFILTSIVLSPTNSMTGKLLMDTGASHGLLLEPSSDERIVVPANTVSTVIGRGLGGVITGKTGRIQSLKLGSYTLDNVLANFPDPNSYMDTLKATLTFRHGSIGGEILSRFTVVFNFPQGKVFLKKNSAFKKEFYFNLSGIDLKAKGAKLDVFEISEVRESSPAEKVGVQTGDIIVSVNGILTKDLHLNELNARLNMKPGKKITLVISRNQVRYTLSFRLENQI